MRSGLSDWYTNVVNCYLRIDCAGKLMRGIEQMRFKANKHYDLFGYDVVLIEDHKSGSPLFRISKEASSFSIDIAVDKNFLKNMDSTEMLKLERLLRELENYAKFDCIKPKE